jgi:hypothetical protein
MQRDEATYILLVNEPSEIAGTRNDHRGLDYSKYSLIIDGISLVIFLSFTSRGLGYIPLNYTTGSSEKSRYNRRQACRTRFILYVEYAS